MPKMIEGRYRHSLVTIRNELFFIGSLDGKESKSCEVFDSTSNKFFMIKRFLSTLTFYSRNIANTFSIGNKLITIGITHQQLYTMT